jgi:hypothetical protein
MNGNRLPLFCDIALAERIERAKAQLIAKATEAAGPAARLSTATGRLERQPSQHPV